MINVSPLRKQGKLPIKTISRNGITPAKSENTSPNTIGTVGKEQPAALQGSCSKDTPALRETERNVINVIPTGTC